MNQPPHPGLRAGLIAVMVASWSLNFIFGKIALRHFAPLTLASFRVELAALLMLPIYVIWRLARGSRVFHRRDFWKFAYLGILGVGVNQVCFTIGLNYTTVGHSALIVGLNPILILLLARLQGLEALTAKKVAGMAMAFVGVAALASEHGFSLHSGTLSGDLITFTGMLGLALYTVLGKRVAAEYDSVSMNAFNYFVGGIVFLPLALRQALGLSRAHAWGLVTWGGWVALGFMVVFASVVAYLIYFWVLRYITASRLGAFGYLHPVMTTALGVTLLGEHLTVPLVGGGALVLAGVYLIESGPRETQPAAIDMQD